MQYTVKNETPVTIYIANNLDTITENGKILKILRSSFYLEEPPKDQYEEIFAISMNAKYIVSLPSGTMVELNMDEVSEHFTFNCGEDSTQIYLEFATIKPGTN